MCGLAAFLALQGETAPAVLQRAMAALRHRGPDGQGTWISDRGDVGLGHARLSVIDLDTGHQPIANEDETARIIVNGEFYDYERIQRRLEAEGHRLRTRSDSEIALHLYEDFGMQFVHKLRGEYAVVIWDQRANKLVAVRDRFGVKPLFYSLWGNVLFLASEMKALFAAGVPARWDPETNYFSARFCPPGRTPFRGVYSVPPGSYLSADRAGIAVRQYWDLDYPRLDEPRSSRSEAEYVADFRTVLDEAVRLRLRADVPVGCYLSGGIDSAAVLGLAARHRKDRIHAFTLRFDHARFDEGAVAEETARKTDAEWVPVTADDRALADNFSDAVYHAEAVCDNANFVGKYLLSRAVHDAGFKVVLTGEGSDEMLGGYWYFRRDMALYDTEGQDPAAILRYRARMDEGARSKFGLGECTPQSPLTQRLLGYTPSMFGATFSRLARLEPLYRREYFAPFRSLDRASLLLNSLDVRGRLERRSPMHQSLYLWAKTGLPEYILTLLGDRMEMAHSVEGRVPFLDHEVAEFLCKVPVHLKVKGSSEKYLLREATKDLLTAAVYGREKHPFVSPPTIDRGQSRMWALIQDTLRSAAARAVPFLEPDALRRLGDDLGAELDGLGAFERGVRDMDVMTVVSTIHLQERFAVASD